MLPGSGAAFKIEQPGYARVARIELHNIHLFNHFKLFKDLSFCGLHFQDIKSLG